MGILVTGGAGFIGSCFVRGLLQGAYPQLAGRPVTVLDRLTYAGNRDNLAPVAAHPDLTVVVGDILDARLVRELMTGVDLVVHFAAESHVDRSIADATAFVRTNVEGTHVLLAAALEAGVDRFVHVSTDEVYGSIEHGAWREEQPLAPNSPYAASKAASDLIALAYHRTHGLPVLVTRCSNNYGPYQHPEKLIPLFVTNLLDGLPVPLYGSGDNRRDWLHVEDHCAAVALVAAKGRPGEVYHIGGGTELSNAEMTERLLSLCGADLSAVRHVADRKGHDRRYCLDITKISEELGYAPRIGLAEGLAGTVDWYRAHRAWWVAAKRRSAGS